MKTATKANFKCLYRHLKPLVSVEKYSWFITMLKTIGLSKREQPRKQISNTCADTWNHLHPLKNIHGLWLPVSIPTQHWFQVFSEVNPCHVQDQLCNLHGLLFHPSPTQRQNTQTFNNICRLRIVSSKAAQCPTWPQNWVVGGQTERRPSALRVARWCTYQRYPPRTTGVGAAEPSDSLTICRHAMCRAHTATGQQIRYWVKENVFKCLVHKKMRKILKITHTKKHKKRARMLTTLSFFVCFLNKYKNKSIGVNKA